MGVVKRFIRLQELENIDVLIDEFDKSRYITISDFPEAFPQGKSSFLIEVSKYLKSNVELKIDIFDSEGSAIYHEPVSDHLEGRARRTSVEIHEDTAPGMATMIIVAELEVIPSGPSEFSDVELVPEEYRGTYNLRFTKNFIVNPTDLNTQPIKFYTQPKLTVTEKVYGSLEITNFGTLATASLGRVFGLPQGNTEGKEFEDHDRDADQGDLLKDQIIDITKDSSDEIVKNPLDPKSDIKEKSYAEKKGIKDNAYEFRSGKIQKKNSPITFPYAIQIDNNNNNEFLTKYAGGRIIFSHFTSSLDNNSLNDLGITPPIAISASNASKPYSASIDSLANNKLALIGEPYTFLSSNVKRVLPFEAVGTVEYEVPPSSSFDYTNTVSVANITLANLRTFSGEAYSAEVLIRSRTSQDISDFRTLAYVPLQPPELLVNENVVAGRIRTGYFGGLDGHFSASQEIDTYWNVSGSSMNGLDSSLSATVTASYTNSDLLDSVHLSGSISGSDKQLTFQLDDAYSFYLRKNVDYTLSFNAVTKLDRLTEKSLMLVYISGSITSHAEDKLYYPAEADSQETEIVDGNDYGYRLGYLTDIDGQLTSSYGRVEHNFAFNSSGSAIVQFRILDGEWNLSDISVTPAYGTGYSPSYVNFLQQMPEEFLVRPDKFDFIVNFYDRSNNLADSVVRLENVEFSGSNMVVVGTDNVLKGNMFIGGKSGDGIDMGGAEAVSSETGKAVGGSGYVRSIGYQGFLSASNASLGGRYGFMMFSGSVWPGSGDDYKGVGLELVGASGSMRFRTNPSLFDVQADSFFVGKTTTQFISGSGQKIEISSSNFHLSASGDVNMTGTITANAGNIGGWKIEDDKLSAGSGNSSVTMSGDNQLIRMGSGSQFGADNVSGVLFGQDTDGKYKFQIGEGISYIYFDGTSVNIRSEDINVTASVFSVDVDVFKLSANNLFISSSDGGFISAGNPRPTGITGTNKGFYVQGNNPGDNKTKVLIGDADGARLTFDGDNFVMSSSTFFLGSADQYLSGSNGNIEISSSTFHVSGGNTIMTGKITANEGSIGGFNITNDALSSTNFLISGSSTGNNYFISSSNFNVRASGDVTASALALTGGEVGGLAVASGEVSVGSILKLKDSGQITGSKVLFTGGKIANWSISGNRLTGGNIKIDSSGFIEASAGGFSNVDDTGDATTGFLVNNSGEVLIKAGGANSNFIKFKDGTLNLNTDTAHISGSSITLETPKFFLGRKGNQYVSGSNGNVEISSSDFHLTAQGDVTASAILLGSKGGGNYLQYVGGTLSVRGDITADSIAVPSAAPTPSSSITSTGLLTTVSASIAGWNVTDEYIYKPISGNLAHQGFSRVYLSSTSSDAKNISEGFTLYRKDEDVSAGETKIIRLGGLSNTTSLHHTRGEYGLQIIRKQPDGSGYENIVYIGGTTQQISGWNLSKTGFTDQTGAVQLSSTEASMSLGTGQEIVIRGNSNSPFISIQPAVALADKAYGEAGIFMGVPTGNPPLFSVVGGANSHIKFNGSVLDIKSEKAIISGSEITLATPKFFLGQHGSQFVSGSNGNIEITSSMFHLDPANNKVSISGSITATDGTIGGWTINHQKLQKDLSGGGFIQAAAFSDTNARFLITPDGNLSAAGGGSWVSMFKYSSDWGIDGYVSGDKIFQLGATNVIAGWTFDADELKAPGNTIILDSDAGGVIKVGSATSLTAGDGTYISGSGVFRAGKVTGGYIKYDGSDIEISSSAFLMGSTGSAYISASSGKMEISSSNFQIKASGDTIMAGKVTATSGFIGGWTINSDNIADASNLFKIDKSALQLSIKNHTFGQAGVQLKYDTSTSKGFFYVGDGANDFIKFDNDGVDIKTDTFKLDTTKLDIDSSTARIEVLTSGSVTYQSDWSSGVDGWSSDLTHAGNIDSVTDGSTSKSNVYRITLVAGTAPKSSRDITLNVGESYTVSLTYLIPDAGSTGGVNGGVDGFRFAMNDSSDIGMGTYASGVIGTWTTVSKTFTATNATTNFRIYPTDGTSYTFSGGSAQIGDLIYISNFTLTPNRVRVRIGEVDSTSADHYGLVIFDGTGTEESDEIVHMSDARNTIASWSLSPTQITSRNLVIDSAGIIQTSDFASNVKGWRITSANNGEAEFENVRIRGTLSTAVFEKETVNAVGGQLYVANSTAITGSTTLAATAATMSVVNVTGFTGSYGGDGEILSAKKISNTGFATEYMFVQSASRDNPTSDTDLTGKLYVIRGYRSGSLGESGSLGDASTLSQSYEPGQVIVSTGRIGTGFIRLNANPNDTTTPYIDIVERTGSGVYDVGLKARLGDLSGLSSGLLYGNSSPGFGLFTENVFLQGAITATTGSIEGILHVRTDLSNQIKMGTNVNGSLDGIHINNNNFWYTNGHFKTGFDNDNYIHQSGSKLEIKSEDIDFQGSNFLLEADGSSGKFYLGTITSDSDTSGQGVFMDSGGHFRVIGNSTNQLIVDGGSLTMKSDAFDLTSTNLGINTSRIFLGTITALDDTSGTGFYLTSSGLFNIQNSSTEYLRNIGSGFELKAENVDISGSNVRIKSPDFYLGDAANYISGSNGSLKIYATGDTTISGSSVNIETPKFYLGQGSTQYISGSNGNIEISSSMFHLDPKNNKVSISGSITATDGKIGGWNMSSYILQSIDSNGGVKFDSYNKQIGIRSGSAVETTIVEFGRIGGTVGSPQFGLEGKDTSGNVIFKLGEAGNEIAGWTITDTEIKSGTNIGINSNTKAFTINDTTYGNTGIQLEYNSGTPRVFIGKSSGEFFKFDGSSVNISSSAFFLGSSEQFISGSNGNIEISSSAFHLDTSDNKMILSGSITATDGNIGGYVINAKSIIGDTNKVILTTDAASVSALDGTGYTGALVAARAGAFGTPSDHWRIANGVISSRSGSTSTGITLSAGSEASLALGANSATMTQTSRTGVFLSGSGTFRVGDPAGERISFDGSSFIVSSSAFLLGDSGSAFISASNSKMEISSSKFQIKSSGDLIVRKVDAEEGTIGGFTIDSGSVKSGTDIEMNATNKYFSINDKVFGNTGIQLQYAGGTPQFFAGKSTGGFVKFDGSDVNISSSAFLMGSTGSAYISASRGQMEISSSNFFVSPTGNVYAGGNFSVTSGGNLTLGDTAAEHIYIANGSDLLFKNASTVMAELDGTTWTLGGGTGTTDDSIRLSSGGGVQIYDSSTAYASITSTGFDVIQSGTNVAHFGSITRVGDSANEHISMSSAGMHIKDGSVTAGKFVAGGVTLGRTNKPHISASNSDIFVKQSSDDYLKIDSDSVDVYAGGTEMATFGSTSRIGDVSNEHVTITSAGMRVMDGTTHRASFGSNAHIEGGSIYVGVTGSSGDWVEIDSGGIDIMRNNVSVANFGDSTARIGSNATPGSGDQNFLHIGPTTMSFMAREDDGANRIDASFGSTTTIGQTGGKHIKITGTAVEVKTDANTTALSASSAGLEMSGKVKATSGDIGGYTITSAYIRSLNTSGNQQNSATLTSGATSGLQLKGDDSSTDTRNDYQLKNGGTNQLNVWTHFPDKDNTDRFMRTRVGVGPTEGIPAHKELASAFPGMSWAWDYHNAYNEVVAYNSGDPTNFPHSESIQILIASGSQKNKNKGVTFRYMVHHDLASGTGDSGGINPGTHGEILRIGKIADATGAWNGGVASIPAYRRYYYGISGSSASTASFGHVRATRFVGDGSGITNVGGGGSMSTWIVTDGSTGETVSDGETITFSNVANETTVAQSGGTVTIGLPDDVTLGGELTTANGSQASPAISLGSADDGFYHDTSDGGIGVMVNNAYDFLLKNGGDFHADGDVFAFSATTSDERLKEDVKTIEFGLNKIKNLRGVEFTWNEGSRKGKREVGVIAQEVEKVLPEIVTETTLPLMDDSGKTYKTVDYDRITAVLIEAVKEQQEQIEELKKEIEEIKNGSAI